MYKELGYHHSEVTNQNVPLEIWEKYLHLSNQVNAVTEHDQLRNYTRIVSKLYGLL